MRVKEENFENKFSNIEISARRSGQGGVIMKKLVIGVCMGALMLSLAACGKEPDQQGSTNQGSSIDPSSTSDQSNVPDQSGSANNGSSSGQDSSGENAGGDVQQGAEGGWSEEMAGLKAAVTEALGENYWPSMELDAEMLEMFFGVSQDLYEDYMAEMPMTSAQVDTLVIVKAKADKVDAVEEALNAYRKDQIENTLQYPSNVGKVQASIVEKIGNYVVFVQLGADTMSVMDSGDEAVIVHCQEVNQQVIELITQKLTQ